MTARYQLALLLQLADLHSIPPANVTVSDPVLTTEEQQLLTEHWGLDVEVPPTQYGSK